MSINASTQVEIQSIVPELLPEHINRDYPDFVEFLQLFTKYLVSENRSAHYANRVANMRDIDEVELKFLTNLQQEIGASIPRSFATDPRLFYTQLTDFYRSRGTPASITSFFRLLYDDEVEIYFPKEDMMIPSDGAWTDFSADVIANYQNYTPSFTYTLSSGTSTITGADDAGFFLEFDTPIVFVTRSGVITQRTDFTPSTGYRTYTNANDPRTDDNITQSVSFSLTFATALQTGDVVKIYRPGSAATTASFASADQKIQDSYYYQKFSYVLKTGANIAQWKTAFNRLVHPAGFIFFGEILIFIELLEKGMPAAQPGRQLGTGLPFQIILPVKEINAQSLRVRNTTLTTNTNTFRFNEDWLTEDTTNATVPITGVITGFTIAGNAPSASSATFNSLPTSSQISTKLLSGTVHVAQTFGTNRPIFNIVNTSGAIGSVDTFSAAHSSRTAGTYTGVSGTTSGSGTGAVFTMTVNSSGAVSGVIITTGGTGHVLNEVITIADSALGGGGGTPFTMRADTINKYSATIVNGGSGFTTNDKYVIPGNALGGATPANDATITITSVGASTLTTKQYVATNNLSGVIASKLGYTTEIARDGSETEFALVHQLERILNQDNRQGNKLGPREVLEDLKFLLPNPNYNFRDYTIQEAINRTIDINCTAIITTS